MEQTGSDNSSRAVVLTLGFVLFLYVSWVAAWMLERWLEGTAGWLPTAGLRSAYWTAMKLLLWILPAISLIRLTGRRVRDVMVFGGLRSVLAWGGGTGLALGALSLITKMLDHRPLLPSSVSWPLISAVLIAPVIEEFTFRGAVLGGLMQRYRFAVANTLTALLFLGAHIPGWCFQGCLLTNVTSRIGISVLVLGFVFGIVAYKSRSLAAAILAHGLNNLFS